MGHRGRRRGWEGRGMYGAEVACPGGGGPHSGLGPEGGPPGLPHTGGEGWSVGRETSLARKWFARVHYGMVRQTRETREEPMAGGLARRTVAGRGGGEGELGAPSGSARGPGRRRGCPSRGDCRPD